MNRRNFVKTTGLTAAALTVMPGESAFASANEKIEVAVIGVGLRGQNHLNLLLNRADVDVVAICDIDAGMLELSKAMITKSGKPMPKIYTGNENEWKKMILMKGLKAVVIATPWEWHKPMIIGSIEAGIKYIGSEVAIGITLQDHWEVVQAAEKHEAEVMMLENV